MDNIKEYINTGILGVIALTLIYAVFIKEESNTNYRQTRPEVNRQSSIAATPPTAPSAPTAFNQNQAADQAPAPKPSVLDGMPKTKIAFKEAKFDFGTINQDTENEHVFAFTNTGKEPLLIESATGSCGCTVPEYPKKPIAPGESEEIRVVYKPGKQKGKQSKTITIIANTEPKDTRLILTADVKEVS
ncbi:MAG TPA: DUF1573 domain-containing protein [Flavobacteriales bacterium]|jgi:hypothetical protein|nr:DUF1573 domain-containing protein [Flavobacteriales bacterium]